MAEGVAGFAEITGAVAVPWTGPVPRVNDLFLISFDDLVLPLLLRAGGCLEGDTGAFCALGPE